MQIERTINVNVKTALTAISVTGLLAGSYLAAYFALARPGVTFQVSGRWASSVSYLGLPDRAEVCFRPLHRWDRRILRPRLWEGTVPVEERLLAAQMARKAALSSLNHE